MTGAVTADREASLRILVRGPSGQEQSVDTLIDTGFNGYLTLPSPVVAALRLVYHSQTLATLADGQITSLRKFAPSVNWDGLSRDVMVLEADGEPLLGMSLLYGSRVTLDVIDGGSVTVEPLP